ncbi:hypothetical protein EDC01DRAFT_630619 [Geopyxis carbonaria]|nr:hypothetical protein EDC01DRAFT_630619 [Geopyxis carbonaria]
MPVPPSCSRNIHLMRTMKPQASFGGHLLPSCEGHEVPPGWSRYPVPSGKSIRKFLNTRIDDPSMRHVQAALRYLDKHGIANAKIDFDWLAKRRVLESISNNENLDRVGSRIVDKMVLEDIPATKPRSPTLSLGGNDTSPLAKSTAKIDCYKDYDPFDWIVRVVANERAKRYLNRRLSVGERITLATSVQQWSPKRWHGNVHTDSKA